MRLPRITTGPRWRGIDDGAGRLVAWQLRARGALRRATRGRATDDSVGARGGTGPRDGPAGRGLDRRQADPDVLEGRTTAFRRDQHVPQGAVRGRRAALRGI